MVLDDGRAAERRALAESNRSRPGRKAVAAGLEIKALREALAAYKLREKQAAGERPRPPADLPSDECPICGAVSTWAIWEHRPGREAEFYARWCLVCGEPFHRKGDEPAPAKSPPPGEDGWSAPATGRW